MSAAADKAPVFGPLSKSKLYRLMTDFYVEAGVSAWVDHVVPHYISSNAKLAQSYASVIVSGMWDLHHQGKLDKEHPFVVLELGAGSGALAWLLAQALMRLLNERSNSALPPVLYVISDVAQSNIDTMMTDKSGFSEWFDILETDSLGSAADDMGRLSLDWALVDMTGDCRCLELQSSGLTISQASLANPLCVLGTYLLDSIPQDAYRCIGGDLFAQWCNFETRTPGAPPRSEASDDSSESEGSVPSPLGPRGFRRSAEVDLQWDDRPVDGIDQHLQQPAYALEDKNTQDILGTILHWYQQYFLHDSAEYTQDPVAAAGAGSRTRGGSVDTDDSLDSTGAPLERNHSSANASESGTSLHESAQDEGGAAGTSGGGASMPRRLLGASRAGSVSTKGKHSTKSAAESVSLQSISDVHLQGELISQLSPVEAVLSALQDERSSPGKPPGNMHGDSRSVSSRASDSASSQGSEGGGSGTFRSHSSGSRSADSDSDDSSEAGTVSAAFTIPTCAVAALQQLRGLTRGCTLCLWGDKGNCSPTSYVGQSCPHVSLHGSFSLM